MDGIDKDNNEPKKESGFKLPFFNKGDVVNEEDTDYLVTYSEVPDLLKGKLSNISKQDKAIINSMTPALKISLKGERVNVSNKNTDDTKLAIKIKGN